MSRHVIDLGDKCPFEKQEKKEVNYHTMYRNVSAKKTIRTVNVKGESTAKGGKCTTEKIRPRPHTITIAVYESDGVSRLETLESDGGGLPLGVLGNAC